MAWVAPHLNLSSIFLDVKVDLAGLLSPYERNSLASMPTELLVVCSVFQPVNQIQSQNHYSNKPCSDIKEGSNAG